MEEINKFRIINKLKSVYRATSVNQRNESSAEHSWGCLMLADFCMSKTTKPLNKLKVYELLMYHDLVEIESGDTVFHPNIKIDKEFKKQNELNCADILKTKLPNSLNEHFIALFNEYENQETIEAKFAKAIDVLEVIIHQLNYKNDWKDWTGEFLIKHKSSFFNEFPELKKIFYDLIDYLVENDYIKY